MKEPKRHLCMVCGRKFFFPGELKGKRKSAEILRKKGSLTCGPLHSKVYNRIRKHVAEQMNYRITQLKKTIKVMESELKKREKVYKS